MKAVLISKSDCQVVDRDIPSPGPGEILVKNSVVGANPTDYKYPEVYDAYGSIEGHDLAGYVEQVGEDVTRFKKGDKVAAFTRIATNDRYGAYAEYTISDSNLAFHLGPHTSLEDAAAFPLAYMTAAIGLFKILGLPGPGEEGDRDGAVLVYGGATTVGVFAIQLAKLSGLHVVAIAGSSQDVPKKYGADEVIDYRGKSKDELISAITSSHGGKGVTHIYDAVSEGGSAEASFGALIKQGRGGRYTYVLFVGKELLESLPASIQAAQTVCWTAWGDDAAFAEHWFDWLGEKIETGEFKPQKVTVVPGGLGGVKEALRRLKNGEVRGEKLVLRVAETAGLAA